MKYSERRRNVKAAVYNERRLLEKPFPAKPKQSGAPKRTITSKPTEPRKQAAKPKKSGPPKQTTNTKRAEPVRTGNQKRTSTPKRKIEPPKRKSQPKQVQTQIQSDRRKSINSVRAVVLNTAPSTRVDVSSTKSFICFV